jgi:hypothetical protein
VLCRYVIAKPEDGLPWAAAHGRLLALGAVLTRVDSLALLAAPAMPEAALAAAAAAAAAGCVDWLWLCPASAHRLDLFQTRTLTSKHSLVH